MISIIIGGSGSGKSELAENLAVCLNHGQLIYIATMQPFGEEGRKRIERHQSLRQNKNFQTLECYKNLTSISLPRETTVLLECMSNLVANEMFSGDNVSENTFKNIEDGIRSLASQAENFVIVTNNVFEDGFRYDDTTLEYMKVLGQVNRWICSIADQVIEVVHGIPVYIK